MVLKKHFFFLKPFNEKMLKGQTCLHFLSVVVEEDWCARTDTIVTKSEAMITFYIWDKAEFSHCVQNIILNMLKSRKIKKSLRKKV